MKRQNLQFAAAVGVAVAVAISCVWVIEAKHRSRQLFVELEALKRERDRLQVDWGRLQLEQSTWGTHARVESLAREHLRLERSVADRVVVVAEPGP